MAKRTVIKLRIIQLKAHHVAEKPHCVQFHMFKEELIKVEMHKLNQVINKPIQAGFAIPEQSKLFMDQTYDKLTNHFGVNIQTLYTDNDSLTLNIFVPDLYRELRYRPELREPFDFCKIPVDHPCGLGDPLDPHADEVGYFKNEMKSDPIIGFIALKPKMYSFTLCNARLGATQPQIKEKQVGNGIARTSLQELRHLNYVNMCNEGDATKVSNHRVGLKLHHLYTLSQEKRGLVLYDDKRFLLANLSNGTPNPKTHAFGHYAIAHEIHVEQSDQPEAGNGICGISG